MPVSIKDVARRANVSSATVSRVLADKPYISDEIRRRVLDAVKEMGYSPSRVARSLRVNRSNTIGLVIPNLENPFFATLVQAIEETAFDFQYNTFLCLSGEKIEQESTSIDMLLSENVAGVIVAPVQETSSPVKRLLDAKIPVVAVARLITDLEMDSVVLNNHQAAYDLISHLIADGHSRIGAIFSPSTGAAQRERFEGYLQALEMRGIPFLPQLVRRGLPEEHVGYQYTRDLLNLPERPTALFLSNNQVVLGALRAIREQRLHIPDDIALVAFSNSEWTALFRPAITVVSQPAFEMGRTAANLLFERITANGSPCQKKVLPGNILIRQSCARHSPLREEGGGSTNTGDNYMFPMPPK